VCSTLIHTNVHIHIHTYLIHYPSNTCRTPSELRQAVECVYDPNTYKCTHTLLLYILNASFSAFSNARFSAFSMCKSIHIPSNTCRTPSELRQAVECVYDPNTYKCTHKYTYIHTLFTTQATLVAPPTNLGKLLSGSP
jgi:hypothetical protein